MRRMRGIHAALEPVRSEDLGCIQWVAAADEAFRLGWNLAEIDLCSLCLPFFAFPQSSHPLVVRQRKSDIAGANGDLFPPGTSALLQTTFCSRPVAGKGRRNALIMYLLLHMCSGEMRSTSEHD